MFLEFLIKSNNADGNLSVSYITESVKISFLFKSENHLEIKVNSFAGRDIEINDFLEEISFFPFFQLVEVGNFTLRSFPQWY